MVLEDDIFVPVLMRKYSSLSKLRILHVKDNQFRRINCRLSNVGDKNAVKFISVIIFPPPLSTIGF